MTVLGGSSRSRTTRSNARPLYPSPREQPHALVQRREQLVSLVSMEEQRLEQSLDKTVRKLTTRLIKQLKRQILELDELNRRTY
jgi:transposase